MKNVISKITLLAMGIMATMGLTSCMPADASGASAEAGGMSTTMMLGYFAVIIGIMYFVMIRPSNKKRKQEEEMRESLQIGDELITIGGIKGRVVSIKDDESFILETGPDRTRIQFQKWAISTIVTDKPEPAVKAEDKKKSKKQKAEEK